MELKKFASSLLITIVAVMTLAGCDDEYKHSKNIAPHSFALNFVTPSGKNLLDSIGFIDYNKAYNDRHDYLCDDRVTLTCQRGTDGAIADHTDMDNPTYPYSNFKIALPWMYVHIHDMSDYHISYDDSAANDYIHWKIGGTIEFSLLDFDSFTRDKNYDEYYTVSIQSKAIYGDDTPHHLKIYCKVYADKLPEITRCEYDNGTENLLAKDPYSAYAKQIGYKGGDGAHYLQITVDRKS